MFQKLMTLVMDSSLLENIMSKKVDLTLLKRLVAELESAVNTAESIKTDVNTTDKDVELVVEASKAAGLAAGVMQEAGLLIMDIHALMDGGPPLKKNDLIDKLLGSLKGPGSSN
jgi:hypothetical protein